MFGGGQGLVAKVAGDGAEVLAGGHEAVGAQVADGVVAEGPDPGLAADAEQAAPALIEGPAGPGIGKDIFRVFPAALEGQEVFPELRGQGEPVLLQLPAPAFPGPQADFGALPIQILPF